MRSRTAATILGLAALVSAVLLAGVPASAGPPSIGTSGISFSAGTATDPQRDVGEPEIHIDRAGRVWTCGPSGFSNVADYAQVSTDGGDQFHLLGQPPRGQISLGEGGGDCGLATAPYPNTAGGSDYTFAYTGLGPLTSFSTATSPDSGHTLLAGPVSESPPGVDRQWNVFTDQNTVFLNYNQLVLGYTVQKSTDGGLTYGEALSVGGGNGRIGPLRAILSPDGDASKAIVYFPSYEGTRITLFRSMNGGDTWSDCTVRNAGFNPSAGFVIADNDSAGNVYIAYTEKGGGRDTYMVAVPANRLASCSNGANLNIANQHRVNRDAVETTVMPWLVAGDTGRVAVTFFGTDTAGDPNSGSIVASWYPYVSMSLNALDASPAWAQAKATTHPFHYGSICLNGLYCDLSVPEGDRSLADYFAMDLDPVTGRLHLVFGTAAKKPSDKIGHVSTATVVTQETGPSLLTSKTLVSRRPVSRQETLDPAGDALAPYSQLYLTPSPVNQPAMDVRRVAVGPEVDLGTGSPVANGGMTVTMEMADLGAPALQSALLNTASQSLVYLFRFMNGFQPAGATAAWNPVTGWSFGFDDYETTATESGQADPTSEKIVVWHQATAIQGKVEGNTLKLSVPRSLLRAQTGPTGANQVPVEQTAVAGSTLFNGMAYTLGNSASPVQAVQSYLYPVDSTAAMDFQVGVAASAPQKAGGKPAVLGTRKTAPAADLPSTGVSETASLAALLFVLAVAGAAGIRRIRTR